MWLKISEKMTVKDFGNLDIFCIFLLGFEKKIVGHKFLWKMFRKRVFSVPEPRSSLRSPWGKEMSITSSFNFSCCTAGSCCCPELSFPSLVRSRMARQLQFNQLSLSSPEPATSRSSPRPLSPTSKTSSRPKVSSSWRRRWPGCRMRCGSGRWRCGGGWGRVGATSRRIDANQ